MAAYLGKSLLYVGQEDGFVHKYEQYAASGTNRVVSTDLTNLKFNPDVSDDVFKYQPPPDAEVQDMTPPAGAAPGDAVPQPSTPAPAATPSP
jgi:outer membrane lipoprotein-sorting protein